MDCRSVRTSPSRIWTHIRITSVPSGSYIQRCMRGLYAYHMPPPRAPTVLVHTTRPRSSWWMYFAGGFRLTFSSTPPPARPRGHAKRQVSVRHAAHQVQRGARAVPLLRRGAAVRVVALADGLQEGSELRGGQVLAQQLHHECLGLQRVVEPAHRPPLRQQFHLAPGVEPVQGRPVPVPVPVARPEEHPRGQPPVGPAGGGVQQGPDATRLRGGQSVVAQLRKGRQHPRVALRALGGDGQQRRGLGERPQAQERRPQWVDRRQRSDQVGRAVPVARRGPLLAAAHVEVRRQAHGLVGQPLLPVNVRSPRPVDHGARNHCAAPVRHARAVHCLVGREAADAGSDEAHRCPGGRLQRLQPGGACNGDARGGTGARRQPRAHRLVAPDGRTQAVVRAFPADSLGRPACPGQGAGPGAFCTSYNENAH